MAVALKLRNRDMERVELTVRVPPVFRFRTWLGVQIIKLGVRCTGMRVKVGALTEDELREG